MYQTKLLHDYIVKQFTIMLRKVRQTDNLILFLKAESNTKYCNPLFIINM